MRIPNSDLHRYRYDDWDCDGGPHSIPFSMSRRNLQSALSRNPSPARYERHHICLNQLSGTETWNAALPLGLSFLTAMEKRMTKFGLLGAAAIVSSALVSPAMAQEVIYNPGYCAQFYPNANCQNKGPGNPYTGDYQRRTAYRTGGAWDRHYDTGFDFAEGVVGGAIGTAGAIATAPFRGGSYAYSNGNRGWYGQTYEQRNGFVCKPGTWIKGDDGRRHLCQ